MKTYKIETNSDLIRMIDRIGEMQHDLELRKLELTTCVNTVKFYLALHPEAKRGKTERYRYVLKEFARALCRQRDVPLAEIVAKLRNDESTLGFIVPTYDAEQLKDHFGGNAKSREAVEQYGLYFAKPRTELQVEAL